LKWFRLLLAVLLMLAALLFASPVAYADDPPDDSVIYISISGDPTVDIGGCEVSVRRGGLFG